MYIMRVRKRQRRTERKRRKEGERGSILCTIYENRGIKNNKYECNIISQINIRRGGKFSIDSLGRAGLGQLGNVEWTNWADICFPNFGIWQFRQLIEATYLVAHKLWTGPIKVAINVWCCFLMARPYRTETRRVQPREHRIEIRTERIGTIEQ